jgi:hypothetical protein
MSPKFYVIDPVFCPQCWAFVRYVSPDSFACSTHGEVEPVTLEEILPVIRRALIDPSS